MGLWAFIDAGITGIVRWINTYVYTWLHTTSPYCFQSAKGLITSPFSPYDIPPDAVCGSHHPPSNPLQSNALQQ